MLYVEGLTHWWQYVFAQSLHGIVRLKLKDFLSLSLAPRPMIKLGHRWGVPGTGLAVRFRYECPLNYLTGASSGLVNLILLILTAIHDAAKPGMLQQVFCLTITALNQSS